MLKGWILPSGLTLSTPALYCFFTIFPLIAQKSFEMCDLFGLSLRPFQGCCSNALRLRAGFMNTYRLSVYSGVFTVLPSNVCLTFTAIFKKTLPTSARGLCFYEEPALRGVTAAAWFYTPGLTSSSALTSPSPPSLRTAADAI